VKVKFNGARAKQPRVREIVETILKVGQLLKTRQFAGSLLISPSLHPQVHVTFVARIRSSPLPFFSPVSNNIHWRIAQSEILLPADQICHYRLHSPGLSRSSATSTITSK
jgi:hypothetical protein